MNPSETQSTSAEPPQPGASSTSANQPSARSGKAAVKNRASAIIAAAQRNQPDDDSFPFWVACRGED